jgi:hypothetical protein
LTFQSLFLVDRFGFYFEVISPSRYRSFIKLSQKIIFLACF